MCVCVCVCVCVDSYISILDNASFSSLKSSLFVSIVFFLCLDLRISQSVDNHQLRKTELSHGKQFDAIEGRQQSFETHVIG